jgi:hypothetical protein
MGQMRLRDREPRGIWPDPREQGEPEPRPRIPRLFRLGWVAGLVCAGRWPEGTTSLHCQYDIEPPGPRDGADSCAWGLAELGRACKKQANPAPSGRGERAGAYRNWVSGWGYAKGPDRVLCPPEERIRFRCWPPGRRPGGLVCGCMSG